MQGVAKSSSSSSSGAKRASKLLEPEVVGNGDGEFEREEVLQEVIFPSEIHPSPGPSPTDSHFESKSKPEESEEIGQLSNAAGVTVTGASTTTPETTTEGKGKDHFSEWSHAFQLSAKAALVSIDQLKRGIPPGGNDWPLEMSLVLMKDSESESLKVKGSASSAGSAGPSSELTSASPAFDVVIVAWRISGKCGRIIPLDERNRVIATNPTCRIFDCQPGNRHAGSEIVLPATGACPHRCRRFERPDFPPAALRLKHMFEAVGCNGERNTSESLSLDPCFLCGEGGLGVMDLTPESEAVSLCAFCLQSFHVSCATRESEKHSHASLVAAVVAELGADDTSSLQDDLHKCFKTQISDVCCPLCATVLEQV